MTRSTVRPTHKACAECSRVLPRASAYRLRKRSDPHGIATRAQERRKRKGEAPLSDEAFADLAATNPANAVLWIQVVCVECEPSRWARRTVFNALRRAHTDADIRRGDSRWRTFTASGNLPQQAVEEAAAKGLIRVDSDGSPALPVDPESALRFAYAGLICANRVGEFAPEQQALVDAATKLVASMPDGKLTRRLPDVIDVALVRMNGKRASDAMTRILERYRSHHARYAWGKIKNGLMDEDAALARLDEGMLLGVLKWDPLHASKAALSTRCGWWVRRQLQIRTAADRPLGVYKTDEGWSSAALSLGALSGGSDHGEGADAGIYDPHATSYAARGCNQRAHAAAADEDRRMSVQQDIRSALGSLSPCDREMIQRVYVDREQQKAVAADLGLTKEQLAGRLKEVVFGLRETLSHYEEGPVEQAQEVSA